MPLKESADGETEVLCHDCGAFCGLVVSVAEPCEILCVECSENAE